MVNYTKNTFSVYVKTDFYEILFNLQDFNMKIISNTLNDNILQCPIAISIDTLRQKDEGDTIELKSIIRNEQGIAVEFTCDSLIWSQKSIVIICENNAISMHAYVDGSAQKIDFIQYFLDRSRISGKTRSAIPYFETVYAPRFDWSQSKVHISPNLTEKLACQQWLSPPPFCYAFKKDSLWIGCGIAARPGDNNFVSYDYQGGDEFSLSLSYEGHTVVDGTFESPKLVLCFEEKDENDAVEIYIQWLRNKKYIELQPKKIPEWWSEPIFCGWGQQRYDYRQDHDGQENGSFVNVKNYATETIYRRYIDILESKGINPGTIIIDMCWAEKEALGYPCPKKWRDMRGFIDEQHAKGRKVLLWYTPLVANGLPIEACITLEDQIIAPDPTNDIYKNILSREINRMLSSDVGCLNADGFKIDFTQNIPIERGRFKDILTSCWGLISEDVRLDGKYTYKSIDERTELIKTAQPKWGMELLKEYIGNIYLSMKQVKEDSMLITQTANPYFANITDVLRLNDLDGTSPDVLGIMSNRARIAKMCNPDWLIDTDNDLMINKDMWRKYIELQPLLGIPDTYYAYAIATSNELFDESDYELLKSVWQKYRQNKKSKTMEERS